MEQKANIDPIETELYAIKHTESFLKNIPLMALGAKMLISLGRKELNEEKIKQAEEELLKLIKLDLSVTLECMNRIKVIAEIESEKKSPSSKEAEEIPQQ